MSNYPREHASPASQINIRKLTVVSVITLGFGFAHIVAFIALSCLMGLQYQSATAKSWIFPVTLIWFALGFIAHVALSAWTARAVQGVALLSLVETRFPLLVTYFGLVFFPFVPHAYSMDFVDLRSRNSAKPTMKWFSVCSRSAAVNLFATLYLLSVVLLFLPNAFAAIPFLKLGRVFFGMVSLELAVVVHLSLVLMNQRRISRTVRAQSRRYSDL